MDDTIPTVTVTTSKLTPEECADFANSPCVDSFYSLKTQIESANEQWVIEFLEHGGLVRLLDSLCGMTSHGPSNFSDAILQFDCLSCIRALLCFEVGIAYLAQLENGVNQLVSALNTVHSMTKKEVFEILAVLCVFNSQGYYSVLQSLQHYKKEATQTHRFSILITELNQADTVGYKCSIVTAINCIISANDNLHGRHKIRNEFIGLGLLDAFTYIQKEDTDEDLNIQLEAFYGQKYQDDDKLNMMYEGDFQSPSELLNMLIEKIIGTPKYISFLHILQDLLKLELDDEQIDSSVNKWQLIEDLAAKVQHGETPHWMEPRKAKKRNGSANLFKDDLVSFPKGSSSNDAILPLIKAPAGTELDPYRNERKGDGNYNKLSLWMCFTPSKKLKRLQWLKIPSEEIDKPKRCVWRVSNDFLPMLPNFTKIEELFSTKFPDEKLHLVTRQTLMNVTLFLNRTDYDAEDLIKSLQTKDASQVPMVTLSNLVSVLPTPEEVSMLHSFTGDISSLHPSEQFLIELTSVKDFRVLLQGYLLQDEFLAKFVKLRSNIRHLIDACKAILEDSSLRDMLHLILGVGNYLNQGSCYGNACGFKLSSLSLLEEMKTSTMVNQSLLHHLVQLVEENDREVLMFTAETETLEKASECRLDDIRSEINTMNDNLKHFLQDLTIASSNVTHMFNLFIEDVKQHFNDLVSRLGVLRALSQQVAEYFCERFDDFNLQICLQQLSDFYKSVSKCRTENFIFKKQHNLAQARMKQFKGHLKKQKLALQFGQEAGACSSAIEKKQGVLDKILLEVHSGNFRKFLEKSAHLISTPAREMKGKHELEFSRISLAGSQLKLPIMVYDDLDDTLTEIQALKDKLQIPDNLNFEDGSTTLPHSKKPQMQKPIRKTHARSRSDLTSSILRGEDQWDKYNQMCQIEQGQVLQRAPLARPESSCTIASLQLENQGHILTQEEVHSIEKAPPLEGLTQDKPKKSERRSSFGNFISRLSKAVLKPRNSVTNRQSQGLNRLSLEKEKSNKQASDDKENAPLKNVGCSTAGKRFASRDYLRFKSRKHPTVQE